jgi:hypothetical protein
MLSTLSRKHTLSLLNLKYMLLQELFLFTEGTK